MTGTGSARVETLASMRLASSGWHFSRAFVTHVWVLIVAAIAWELIARSANLFYFPPLTTVLEHARQMWFSGPASSGGCPSFFRRVVPPSFRAAVLGPLAACAQGPLAHTAFGPLPRWGDLAAPTLLSPRPDPPVALVPIFMLLFGIGSEMRITLIAFTSVWPILLNTITGVRSVEPLYHATARLFRIGIRKRLVYIVLPASAPLILAGLRVSTALALIVMVLSEMVAATSGIGYRLMFEQQSFALANMWACIVLLGTIGYLLNAIVVLLEKRLLRWLPTPRE